MKLRIPIHLGRFPKPESVRLQGELTLRHLRDGKVINERTIKNLIVDTGRAKAAGLLNEVTSTGFKWLAIGVGATAPTVGDTALGSEITTGGGARALATCSRVTVNVTNDTAQMVYQWTFSAPFAITESGIFDQLAVGGVMLARQTFTAINVVSTDKLEITWKVTAS